MICKVLTSPFSIQVKASCVCTPVSQEHEEGEISNIGAMATSLFPSADNLPSVQVKFSKDVLILSLCPTPPSRNPSTVWSFFCSELFLSSSGSQASFVTALSHRLPAPQQPQDQLQCSHSQILQQQKQKSTQSEGQGLASSCTFCKNGRFTFR